MLIGFRTGNFTGQEIKKGTYRIRRRSLFLQGGIPLSDRVTSEGVCHLVPFRGRNGKVVVSIRELISVLDTDSMFVAIDIKSFSKA